MSITHHYIEQGAGEPLVLLHGNGEDGGYFARQLPAFAPYFRVIAPDTRGHGRTPRGEAPFTLSQFADDLLVLLDRLGIARAHLLGFSDGGNIALTFALRYPERVGKLVLNGANLDPSGVKRSVQRPIELGWRIARAFAGKSGAAGQRTRVRRKAELLGLMVNEPHFRPEELSRLTIPVLVIAGGRDMIREEHTRLIARSIPGAQLAILPGDHFLAARNPEPFNARVLQFLREKF